MNFSSRPLVSKVPTTSAVRPCRSARRNRQMARRPARRGGSARLRRERGRRGRARRRTATSDWARKRPAGRPFRHSRRRRLRHPLRRARPGRPRRRETRYRATSARGISVLDGLLPVAADAEEPLLQAAVGGELARRHDAVDAAVDHDRDVLGDCGGDADVLLDDEDRDVAFLGEAHEHFLELRDNERGEALGRLVHHEQARIAQQRPGDSEHLLLAAGELGAAARAPLGELRKGVVDAIDRPRRVGRVARRQAAGARPPKGCARRGVPAGRSRRRGGRCRARRAW